MFLIVSRLDLVDKKYKLLTYYDDVTILSICVHSNPKAYNLQCFCAFPEGLFGKAKRKLLGRERDPDDDLSLFPADATGPDTPVVNATLVGGIDPAMWEPQEIGTR